MTHWTQYSNNANSTKTDRKIIAILSVRNITISKKFINMNTKVVVDLQKIAARGKFINRKTLFLVLWIKNQLFLKNYTLKKEGHNDLVLWSTPVARFCTHGNLYT